MAPVNVPAEFEVRSFIRSWDNRGYLKTLGSPWIRPRPRSLFCKIFNELLYAWTLRQAKFEVRSFIHSWDNKGYFKIFGTLQTRHTSLQLFVTVSKLACHVNIF